MKHFFRKAVRNFLGFAVALALPACLQNETTLTLEKDGSGTIVEETMLGAQMMEMMTQFAQPGMPDPIEEMFSKQKAKDKAAELGEGVEFVKIEMLDKDGRRGARMHYKFADINTLSLNPGDAVGDMNQQAPGAPKPEKKAEDNVRFEYAGGKLKITTPATDYKDMDMSDENAENPQMEEMMTTMLADMRIRMKLVIAPGIEATTASHVEGDTITLFDVKVGEMISQKDQLKKIAETAKTDKEAAKTEFGKLDGVKVETKESVEVTVK